MPHQMQSGPALYITLAEWLLLSDRNAAVPPYAEPGMVAPPADDAQLRDITDEATGMAQLRRLYSASTSVRCGPSDGRIAHVRITTEAHKQYQKTLRLEANRIPYEKLAAILDWPPLCVPGHTLHRFAGILFPDHPWVNVFQHGQQEHSVHANDVLVLRRTACVLHGCMLAGTDPDTLRCVCSMTMERACHTPICVCDALQTTHR